MSTAEDALTPVNSPRPARPELLAPAGDADGLRAAVENGADAVYFGLRGGFNARARAANFAADELPELMRLLHQRGVKGYLALNTLVFDDELEELERAARGAVAAGVDAVLVQDLGAARLLHALAPTWPIHASTQMSLSSGEGILVAESLGVERVVLARELSIDEIRQIRGQTGLGLEVFVHGALCMSVSGQCLASFAMGGRSANRGQCAQPCRLPYRLVCDGREVDAGERPYLLSPQDLAAYDLLPQLLAAGVDAFKIEGRLKSAAYVAHVTRHYREAIDAAIAGHGTACTPQQIAELEVAFSRGFCHGWLEGRDPENLVPGHSSTKRGVYLGEVRRAGRGRVTIALTAAVQRGDGVVFEGEAADDLRQGGRVYGVFRQGRAVDEPVSAGEVELSFASEAIELSQLRPGQKLWKTDDAQLTRRLRKSYGGTRWRRRVALDLIVEAAAGRPLCITARAASGAACRIASPAVLAEALKHPLTAAVLAEQLGRLGGTAYQLRHVDARIEGRPMAPLSVLGELRHELVARLDASLAARPPREMATQSPLPALRASLCEVQPRGTVPIFGVSCGDDRRELGQSPPQLHVLCRRPEQVPASLDAGAMSLVLDFPEVEPYGEAVALAQAAGAVVSLATPRIQTPGEMKFLAAMLRQGADGMLVRNLAAAAWCAAQGVPFVADFSLHAANGLTVDYLRRLGACRVTAAYDCPAQQLLALAAAAPAGALEVVAYQHLPMFFMQHCVFRAVQTPSGASGGGSDCGQPCRRHEVRLRDRLGVEHPLRAEAACRNTLFHAEPWNMADAVPALLQAGVRHFRLEWLDEGKAAIGRVLGQFGRLLRG